MWISIKYKDYSQDYVKGHNAAEVKLLSTVLMFLIHDAFEKKVLVYVDQFYIITVYNRTR